VAYQMGDENCFRARRKGTHVNAIVEIMLVLLEPSLDLHDGDEESEIGSE